MRQRCVGLPVSSIKVIDSHGLRLRIQTPYIDVHAVRIGTRSVKWFYATGFAKRVFGDAGIECISGEVFAALQ